MLFIFDMGGVVSGNVQTIPAMVDRLGLTFGEFFALCGVPEGTPPANLYDFGLLAAIQSGAIDSAAFWKSFRKNAETMLPAKHPARERVSAITRSENLWGTCFRPEPMRDTIEIIRALKRNGNRVVCGTNVIDAHYAIHKKAGDYDVFDKVYASHFMGLIKPHREFWERIIELERADPGLTFFIDDNPPNVEGAKAAGIKSILFTSAGALAETLADYLKPASAEVRA